MAQLSLKGINKIYDNGFHAVHDFNMEIEKGEFVVFVGPSGCGKSTTLRMIAGLEEISEGELYIGGALSNKKSPRDRGIAMVFQSYALYPTMTVYENMGFGLSLKGMDEDLIEQRVKRTAKILGLSDYLERYPRELSGGQRQRVAVGRAIIRHVEVFLMDEPLSNLDAKQRVTMRAEITQIHRSVGATTIYVTHDQTEAMTMADRIVVMKDGYVQQIGTPKELYFHPVNQFVAGFIGEPPMNFLDCKSANGIAHLSAASDERFDFSAFDELKEPSAFVLGFRPENALLLRGGASSTQEGISIRATVELTEMLGDNVNVYLNVGDAKLIVKTAPHDMPEIGEELFCFAPNEKLHFFDAKSGALLLDVGARAGVAQ